MRLGQRVSWRGELLYTILLIRTMETSNNRAKCSATFGVLHRIAYRVQGDNNKREIVVSTTRPETVFGDRAIGVHPDDPRYAVIAQSPRCQFCSR